MNHLDKEGLIADYLNGQLNDDEMAQVEDCIRNDPEFAANMQSAKMLQTALKARGDNTTQPDFEAFSKRLDRKPWYAKWYNWAPVPAAALAVFVIVTPSTQVNEFETLTDTNQVYTQPAVRLVADSQSNLDALISEYQLSVIKRYPGVNAVDVTHSSNLPETIKQLEADSRTVLIKPLGD